MLAATIENGKQLSGLPYPLMMSPKIDGFRCLIIGGVAYTRSGKRHPNPTIQAWAATLPPHFFDGELVIGNRIDGIFNVTSSLLRTERPLPEDIEWTFFCFDGAPCAAGALNYEYAHRWNWLCETLGAHRDPHVVPLPNCTLVHCAEDVDSAFRIWRQSMPAIEGFVLRNPHARYKNGRSTFRSADLLKCKPAPNQSLLNATAFHDEIEAHVVGYEPLHVNIGDRKVNALGYSETSHTQADLFATAQLGSLQCVTLEPQPRTVSVGSGFTQAERIALWAERASLIGRIVTIRHMPQGAKDGGSLRHPVFIRFRPIVDGGLA